MKTILNEDQNNEIEELIKEEYGEENLEEFDKIKQPKKILRYGDIKLVTAHLPHFNHLDKSIHLEGSCYGLVKKNCYHQLVSLSIPEHLRILRIGNIKTCMRVHLSAPLPSGKGKKEIAEGVKRIYQIFNPNANIKEPRAIHKEQLIGKVLKRKEKYKDEKGKSKTKEVWIKKYGFLNADLLILEEAHEIFNSNEKNDVDCRDAITIALDIWKENLIQKQNIDNLDNEDETLSYHPYVHLMSFFQPIPLQEKFLTKGLQRRVNIAYQTLPDETPTDDFVSRLFGKSDDIESINDFVKFMRSINSLQTEWEFDKDAVEDFILLHKALLQQGFLQGGKKRNYTKLLEYPLQNILLKFSGINALCNLRTKITKEDIQNAYMDVIERFTMELEFTQKYVRGQLDYGDAWGGATGKKQECLEWLYRNVNLNGRVKILEFQKKIAQIYKKDLRTAQRYYSTWKEEELIQDQRGQAGDNSVKLNFEPKIRTPNTSDSINPLAYYEQISSRYDKINPDMTNDVISETPQIYTSKGEKRQKDFRYDKMSDMTDKTEKKQESILKENFLYKKNKKSSKGVISVICRKKEGDRDIQFWDADECSNIEPTHTKEQILEFCKNNPQTTPEELYNKFGDGCLKFRNELKEEGLI